MTHDDIEPFGALIHAAYIDYTTTVSEPAWAVSHETASLLAWLCATRQPDRVCDLGSGSASANRGGRLGGHARPSLSCMPCHRLYLEDS